MKSIWKVSAEESGMKLLDFLKKHLPAQSARSLKKALDQNACEVNGMGERFASAIVGKGDEVALWLLVPDSEEESIPFDRNRILFENEDFLFYDKPAGRPSDDKKFLDSLHKKYAYIELLHRLDRDTTGVLMLAKSPDVRSQTIGYFKKHEVKKTYFALVDGIPKKKNGIIDNYLGKKKAYEGQAIWGEVKPDAGLHAVTEWELVQTGKEASLLRCFPKTGRTHQLRVHLSGMGHPILGDYQYGRHFRCSCRPRRCLLHAAEISFEHPKGHRLNVASTIPLDFMKAMDELQCTF